MHIVCTNAGTNDFSIDKFMQRIHISSSQREKLGLCDPKTADQSQMKKIQITQKKLNKKQLKKQFHHHSTHESQSFNIRKSKFFFFSIFFVFPANCEINHLIGMCLIDSSWLGISTTKYFSSISYVGRRSRAECEREILRHVTGPLTPSAPSSISCEIDKVSGALKREREKKNLGAVSRRWKS